MTANPILAAIERKLLFSGNRHFETGCDGKRQHATEGEAKRAARRTTKHYHKQFEAYHCSFCNNWHVGTKRREHETAISFVGYLDSGMDP